MLTLDTHTLIWWVDQSPKLSPVAQKALAGISPDRPVMVSSISVWELYMLVAKGRLEMKTDPAHWVRQCEKSEKIRFVPIDNEIARISVQLPSSVHDDPADRLIIATALSLGVPLITRDAKIRASGVVKTIW